MARDMILKNDLIIHRFIVIFLQGYTYNGKPKFSYSFAFHFHFIFPFLCRFPFGLYAGCLHLKCQRQKLLFHFGKMRFNVLGQIVTALGRIIAAGALKDRTFRCEAAFKATMATETLSGLVGFATLIAGMLIPGEYEICKKFVEPNMMGREHTHGERKNSTQQHKCE